MLCLSISNSNLCVCVSSLCFISFPLCIQLLNLYYNLFTAILVKVTFVSVAVVSCLLRSSFSDTECTLLTPYLFISNKRKSIDTLSFYRYLIFCTIYRFHLSIPNYILSQQVINIHQQPLVSAVNCSPPDTARA